MEIMTVEQARGLLLGRIARMPTEQVALLDALGRVLAEDALSDIDVAPFDNSAMDGFAVRAADLSGASARTPSVLRVVSHIAAGDYTEIPVGPGEAARIMTGAPVPSGADSVVMIERTHPIDGDGGLGSHVAFEVEPCFGENIRRRGEEVLAGQAVLSAGEVLGAAGIGLLASTGHAVVPVVRRPRVAIVSTGSELVDVDVEPGPGKIRDSNSYSIATQVISAGGVPLRSPIVSDDLSSTREAFAQAARAADFIVTSGGVSVGDFDFVRPVLEELGEITFCKVKMRPGSPQTMGSIAGVPFFGLPGNPTAAYVGFELFIRPALRSMQGFTALDRPVVEAVLAHDIKKKKGPRSYLRAKITREDVGLAVALTGSQSSALLTATHHSNCLMVLPEGEGLFGVGTPVSCMRLDVPEGTPL